MKRTRTLVASIIATFLVISQFPTSSLNAWEQLSAEPTHAQNVGDTDLSVQLVGPSTVNAGGTLSYTLNVANAGPGDATQVVVHNPIPAGLTFNANLSDPPCVVVGADVKCMNFDLNANATESFTVVFDVPAANCQASTVQHTANVFSMGGTTDPNSANNNSQTVSTAIQCPQSHQFAVTKSAPSEVSPGEIFKFAVTVRNTGTTTITDGILADPIDTFTSHLTFLPGQTSSPTHPGVQCSKAGANAPVLCTGITLAPGAVATYLLGFQVNNNAPCTGAFGNVADFHVDSSNTTVWSNTTSTNFDCPPLVDLAVEKSGPSTVNKGGTILYTVSVIHVSGPTATNVLVQDVIPENTTFNPALSSPECSMFDSTEIRCSTTTLTSAQGRKDFTLAFTVSNTVACNAVIVNAAAVCSADQDDPNPDNDVAPNDVHTTVLCPPEGTDLTVQKTGPASVTRGGTISYTLTATNNGPQNATQVVVRDPIPAGFTTADFNAALSSPECVLVGADVKCMNFDLNANQSKTFTVTFNVPTVANCQQTSVQNVANIFTMGGTTDPNSNNNTSQTVTTQLYCPQPTTTTLEVQKTGPASAIRGQALQYQLQVTNVGQVAAQNVVVTDPVPLGLGFNPNGSDPRCLASQGNVVCTVGTLGAGLSTTINLTFQVPTIEPCVTGTIQNTAFASSANSPLAQSQTVQTTLQCPQQNNPQITVIKEAPSVVQRGDEFQYEITVKNVGQTTVFDGVLADPVDTFTNHIVFNPQQSGSPTHPSVDCVKGPSAFDPIVCTPVTLAAGQSITYVLSFRVKDLATCNDVFLNVADFHIPATNTTIWSNVTETRIDCLVPQGADLLIIKSGPQTATRGGTIAYTVTAINAGPGVATNIVIADVIPAGLTFNAAQSSQGCALNGNGTSVLCNNFDLNSGASRTFTIVFNIPNVNPGQCVPTTIHNVATVSASSTDPNSSNNTSATVSTQIDCPVQQNTTLIIQKTGPASVQRGQPIGYTLQVQNVGQAVANNVVVTDPVPLGLVFQPGSSDQRCSALGGNIVCNIGTLGIGQSTSLPLSFQTPTIAPCVTGTVQNQAFVTSNQSTVTYSQVVQTQITCPQQQTTTLTVQKTGPASVQRGNQINYSLLVQNIGQITANNVVVSDPIPSGLQFVTAGSDQRCSVVASTIVCNVGTLTAGQSTSLALNLQFQPTADVCVPGTIQNQAFATSTQSTQAQSQIVTTQVTCPVQQNPSLSIQKTGAATVSRGQILSYTIQVTNTSQVAAQNVTVTDHTPAGVTFTSTGSDQRCSLQSASVVCNIGTLNAGQSTSLTLNFQVPTIEPCVTGTIQNQASVIATNVSQVLSQYVTTSILCPIVETKADVMVEKTGPAVASRGSQIAYTLTVRNLGTATANNVIVSDPIPSGLTYNPVGSSGECTLVGASVSCNVGTLTSGQSKTLTLNFNTPSVTDVCSQTNILNVATVSTTTLESNYANNQSQTVTTILQCPTTSFTISKTDNRSTVEPGETLTYTITISNSSSVSANNVTITDILPGLVSFISASDGGFVSGQTVTWNNQFFSSNQTRTYTVTVRVSSTARDNDLLTNVAYIGGISATDTTRVEDEEDDIDIRLNITDHPDPVRVRGELRYTLAIRNDENRDRRVDVRGFLDECTSFVDASDDGEDVSDDEVEWENIDLDRNSTTFLTLTVDLESCAREGDVLRFTATADGARDSEDTRVIDDRGPIPDDRGATVFIAKQADRGEVYPGDVIYYAITVRNTSSTVARDFLVGDSYPSDKVTIVETGGAESANGRLQWRIDSLAPNETRTFTYSARAHAYLAHGDIILNTARATGGNLESSPSASVDVRVILQLPQTGIEDFTKPFDSGSRFLRPISSAGNVPAIVWTSFILMGIAAGGRFGRRFLF